MKRNTLPSLKNVEFALFLVKEKLIEKIPGCTAVRNKIPKNHVNYELYCNLVPNEDDREPFFDQVPRTGSFEVSYKGMVSQLLFSFHNTSFKVDLL
jgi:hypothetical protein